VPVYEYACTDCGERLEVRQSFTDDPLTECPACSGRLRKVLSPVGVVFKGSGFYRTDSRAADNGSSSGGDKSDKGDQKSSTGSTKETAGAGASANGSSGGSNPASTGSTAGASTPSSSSAKPKAATSS
jgi:putative FmdB family regulatory protein